MVAYLFEVGRGGLSAKLSWASRFPFVDKEDRATKPRQQWLIGRKFWLGRNSIEKWRPHKKAQAKVATVRITGKKQRLFPPMDVP